jgi:Ulp1 protease family, C-terminal catalytic domain
MATSPTIFDDIDRTSFNTLKDRIKGDKNYIHTDANDKIVNIVIKAYFYLQLSFESYINYCNVYTNIQQHLVARLATPTSNENNSIVHQILRNAVVLVQMYKYIENGERYSTDDIEMQTSFNVKTIPAHKLGYNGFGCDDFQSGEKRKETLLMKLIKCFKRKSNIDNITEKYFIQLNTISHEANDKLNELKKIIPSLTIHGDLMFVSMDVSGVGRVPKPIAILTPLFHLSVKRYTIPLWTEEQWKVFGMADTGPLAMNSLLGENMVTPTSNQQLNKLRQQIDAAVTQKHAVPPKTGSKATKIGDGTKRLKRKPLTNNDDTDDSDDDLIPSINVDPTTPTPATSNPMTMTSNPPSSKFVADLMKKITTKKERQLVNDCIQEGKETDMDDVEKNKFLNEIMTSIIGIGDNSIIRKDLRTLRPGQWLNDAIINFYLSNCLRLRNKSFLYLNTFFFMTLMNEHNLGKKAKGKYDFDNVRHWKLKGIPINIFEKKKTFIPINQENYHWVLVVIDNEKKKIQHYNSMRPTVKEETSEITQSERHGNEVTNILRYMNQLHLEKYEVNMNHEWEVEHVVNHPRQINGELVEIEELLFTLP